MSGEFRDEIARNLQSSRRAHGFKSAKAMADALGISASKYTEYEQGRVSCPLDVAWDIADVLGITLDELAGREWPQAPALTPDERRLVEDYRGCTPRERNVLRMTASTMSDGGHAKNMGYGRAEEAV